MPPRHGQSQLISPVSGLKAASWPASFSSCWALARSSRIFGVMDSRVLVSSGVSSFLRYESAETIQYHIISKLAESLIDPVCAEALRTPGPTPSSNRFVHIHDGCSANTLLVL